MKIIGWIMIAVPILLLFVLAFCWVGIIPMLVIPGVVLGSIGYGLIATRLIKSKPNDWE